MCFKRHIENVFQISLDGSAIIQSAQGSFMGCHIRSIVLFRIKFDLPLVDSS